MSAENNAYHSDYSVLSSSMIKTIAEDPAKFKSNYIDGNRSESTAPHFIEGSYVHSLILEPEKTVTEYAIFPGFRKAGADYEAFSAAHNGKVIISQPQMHRCGNLFRGYKARKEATDLVTGGLAEHTLTSSILNIAVKCRADYINPDAGYIVDVKTTAELSGTDMFKFTIQRFQYDLSAALYCQIAYDTYGKLFDFYWVVISKADGECHVYKASTETLSAGAAKYTQGLIIYKKCLASGVWGKPQPTDRSTKTYEIVEI